MLRLAGASLLTSLALLGGGCEGSGVEDEHEVADTADADGERMSVEALSEALEDVVANIDAVHFDTVDGRPEALEEAIARAREDIEAPMSEDDFERVLGRMLASLADAHTGVAPREAALAELDGIELPFVWLDEGPVITRSVAGLELGDRISTLGGMSPDAIMAALAEHVGHENNYSLRHVATELVPRGGWLRAMDLVVGGGVEVHVERKGEMIEVLLMLETGLAPAPARAPLGYTLDLDHDLAVFHLDACVYDPLYRDTLAELMSAVADAGITRIALDLRRNNGGDATVAFAFLAYLGHEYASFGSRLRRSDALLVQVPAYADSQLLGLLEMFGVDLDAPILEIPAAALGVLMSSLLPDGGQVEPEQWFTGEVYVMVSPTTFSSAQLFAAMLQDNELATIVGEPTGNASSFHGEKLWFDVPHTQLRISLAASWLTRPDPTRAEASTLAPDLVVWTTAQDLLDGRDAALETIWAQP